jgi:hypothetical protein
MHAHRAQPAAARRHPKARRFLRSNKGFEGRKKENGKGLSVQFKMRGMKHEN